MEWLDDAILFLRRQLGRLARAAARQVEMVLVNGAGQRRASGLAGEIGGFLYLSVSPLFWISSSPRTL